MRHQLKRNLLVLGSMASELDFQIGMDGYRCGYSFGQAGAHRDHGELRAARYLEHVQVAVAVSRIKGLHGYRHQKIALSLVTHALAAGGMADAVSLVQRVRDVIRESRLFKNPLTIRRRGKRRKRQKQDGGKDFRIHKRLRLSATRTKGRPKTLPPSRWRPARARPRSHGPFDHCFFESTPWPPGWV